MLSTFPTLLPFLLFAFVASITPGPTNILVLSNSARYGFKAALPIVFGACASAALVVFLVGSGVDQILSNQTTLYRVMQWVGALWLSYLAWKMFKAPLDDIDPQVPHKRVGVWGAAALQWVNPKTWMMAVTVISVFAGEGDDRQKHILLLAWFFFCISLPCLTIWALLGVSAKRFFGAMRAQRTFNQSMALLLLISTWLSFC